MRYADEGEAAKGERTFYIYRDHFAFPRSSTVRKWIRKAHVLMANY
jgi:hypothetical protein